MPAKSTFFLFQLMCKLNYFIQQMTYTVSISILTVIALERYWAIIFPMKHSQFGTKRRFVITSLITWLVGILYNILQLVIFDVVTIGEPNNDISFCVNVIQINRHAYFTVNFILWYIIPLSVMVFVYTRISITLWRSGTLSTGRATAGSSNKKRTQNEYSENETDCRSKVPMIHIGKLQCTCQNGYKEQSFSDSSSVITNAAAGKSGQKPPRVRCPVHKRRRFLQRVNLVDNREQNVLKSRRKVIRLLLAVVAAFAILVLPYHLRALWQAWGGTMPHIIGPITMLLMFLNSAINPILYALLSQNFRRTLRKGMRSLICDSVICRCKARRKTWSLSFGQIQTATATSQNP